MAPPRCVDVCVCVYIYVDVDVDRDDKLAFYCCRGGANALFVSMTGAANTDISSPVTGATNMVVCFSDGHSKQRHYRCLQSPHTTTHIYCLCYIIEGHKLPRTHSNIGECPLNLFRTLNGIQGR